MAFVVIAALLIAVAAAIIPGGPLSDRPVDPDNRRRVEITIATQAKLRVDVHWKLGVQDTDNRTVEINVLWSRSALLAPGEVAGVRAEPVGGGILTCSITVDGALPQPAQIQVPSCNLSLVVQPRPAQP